MRDQQLTIRVLLFASYADALGASEVSVELPAGAQTVRSLTVRANFFSTIGARIVSGRSFSPYAPLL